MANSVSFTVIFEDAGEGWVMARVAEVPEVITQGATVDEARTMVQSALRDWLQFYVQEQAGGPIDIPPGAQSEAIELTFAA
jgi:predicted RNase H-like HicB family nuclease